MQTVFITAAVSKLCVLDTVKHRAFIELGSARFAQILNFVVPNDSVIMWTIFSYNLDTVVEYLHVPIFLSGCVNFKRISSAIMLVIDLSA